MASSVGALLQYGNDTPDLEPAPDCSNRLLYYEVALLILFEEQWLKDITHIKVQSNTEGKLSNIKKIKSNSVVEHYVSHTRSMGERHVIADI